MYNGTNERPLAGIRVLDMTFFLSGPYGTQILGDLGAEVIKLESGSGDQTRVVPPHFIGGDSAYFLSTNRNKKSIRLDYKTPAGLTLFKRLVAECDVVMENTRPGHLAHSGIDHEALRREHPRLIWCSISGFGQDGPYAQRPAYDMIVQALSGGMSMTGEVGGKPVRSGIPLGDIAAGMYAVIGVLAALQARTRSGRGDYVDIAMLDCQLAMLTYQASYYLTSGKAPGPQGASHESIPTYRSFTGMDGTDFVVCANTERMWRSFCEVIGRADLVQDPRFSASERHKHKQAIWDIFEPILKTRPASEWVELLQAAEIPVALVHTLDDTFADPQVKHRNMLLEMTDGKGHVARVAGDPLKMSKDTMNYRYPPALGADTAQILRDVLGMTDQEIGGLVDTGALDSADIT